jgi:hypothetical protein
LPERLSVRRFGGSDLPPGRLLFEPLSSCPCGSCREFLLLLAFLCASAFFIVCASGAQCCSAPLLTVVSRMLAAFFASVLPRLRTFRLLVTLKASALARLCQLFVLSSSRPRWVNFCPCSCFVCSCIFVCSVLMFVHSCLPHALRLSKPAGACSCCTKCAHRFLAWY